MQKAAQKWGNMDNFINGISSTYVNNIYNPSTNAIEDKINNSDLSKATDEELMEVCKDFEGYFVEQMLKAMIKMSKVDGSSDDNMYSGLFGVTGSSDTGMSTLSSYFGDEMIKNVSDKIVDSNGGGGLGLAQQLYEQMKRNYAVEEIE